MARFKRRFIVREIASLTLAMTNGKKVFKINF